MKYIQKIAVCMFSPSTKKAELFILNNKTKTKKLWK